MSFLESIAMNKDIKSVLGAGAFVLAEFFEVGGGDYAGGESDYGYAEEWGEHRDDAADTRYRAQVAVTYGGKRYRGPI